jgi:AraC-like DNA-binding protein
MIRLIVLLSPVFVSLFWAVALMGQAKKYSAPRIFLSKFMMLNAVIFAGHFLYFAPVPELFFYFDPLLQMVGMLIFPLYHIYIRLLTVDEKFSWRIHAPFLAISFIVGIFYFIATLLTPASEYRLWLYNNLGTIPISEVYLVILARNVIRITFAIQLIYIWIANYLLMKKYGHKASAFYSDIQDSNSRYVKLINYSILMICVLSFVYTSLGRNYLMNENNLIYLGWSGFAFTLYAIGYSGIKQKPLNPAYEITEPKGFVVENEEFVFKDQQLLADKIVNEFRQNKIYLNPELTILDVVKIIGTNRTYVSNVINQVFNQNFCAFVNAYRIEELQQLLLEDRKYTMEELADNCGFGLVSSMKRAVIAKTNLPFSEFRNQLLKSVMVERTAV